MSQTETIQTPQDYVNYTFNIEARGVAEVSSELIGLSNTVGNILGQIAFKTSEFLSHTDMLAIGVGAAISSMFVSATRDAITFQQQVANVQAIGGEAINAGAIGDAAMEYSNQFGMATASMTEGLEALARAGITSTNVMKEVLADIQSGKFAKEFIAECESGCKKFHAMREEQYSAQISETGRQLRSMMSFLK